MLLYTGEVQGSVFVGGGAINTANKAFLILFCPKYI
jgi:hypothetical protein